jgi:DNA-binding MarR family transcriptional regulator
MMRFRYPPEGVRANRSLGYLLHRAHKLARQRVEKVFEGQSLTLSQWIALSLLREGAVTTPGEIAERLGHDTGATTRLVSQLEGLGLIDRARGTEDQRIVTLSLTAGGERSFAELSPTVSEIWNSMLAGFDRNEVEALIKLLGLFILRLEEDDE